MCGILGLIDKENINLISKMNHLLDYRGPDDGGEYVERENGIALAMRRLAILDLAGGKQPMANKEENLWIVFNGEIYNSITLRQRLMDKGYSFKTRNSDTEVLLCLYEDKGKDMLDDLNGMFAFVIYDKRNNILFGARDRIGIKPLYFSRGNGKFAFSSELKSLLLLPWISREINRTSLYHYLSFQFVPAPDSIFSGIKKLQAGHFFEYDLAQKELSVQKYWDLDVSRQEERPLDEWKEIIRGELERSVKRWSLSDVPIACSLSGGIDSSSVVGLLAQSGEKDIRTYSLGFELPEEDFSELTLARMVSRKWNTKHHEAILKPEEVLSDIESMVWHLDEPYGGGLPSWYIYKMISKDAKVCLTGTGGDELFGNYGKYRIYERGKWYRYLKTFQEAARSHSYKKIRDGFKFPVGHFYPRYFSDAVKDELILDGKWFPSVKTEEYLTDIWNQSNTSNPRNAVAYVDFHLQLPEEFLLVTDRFSMAHSVEARTPFLDHQLVELAFKLPPHIRTGWNEPKSFLKSVVRDLLPREILDAPKKGFILPLHLWTRKELKPLIEDLLSPGYLERQGIFSPKVYSRIVKPHLSHKADYTQQVWTLLMFQMWYRKFFRDGAADA